jgi:ribosomal protein L25 (general stress protein Ctc)
MSEATTVNVTIEAALRTGTGKSYTRKLRTSGKIPAVLLENGKSTILELDPKLLPKAWKSGGRKFDLVLAGKTIAVKMQELQIDPCKRTAIHVDLMKA